MTRVTPTLLLQTVLLALSAASGAAWAAGEWPQFRGPTGQGIAADAKGLPATWGETENVTWKTPVTGKAWSSPVVWGDQVWVSNATPDARQLSAVCVDKATGKVVHDLKLFDVPVPQYIIAFNSGGSPTPVIEEGRVYVTFGAPGTACIDTKTGKVLWERRDLLVNHFRGAGSSPVLFGDLLIMNFDGSDAQYVVALDKHTGRTAWKVDRSIDFQDLDAGGKPQAQGDFRKAFSTPRVATFKEHDNKPILLSAGSKALYAYDPATGGEIWRVENRSQHSTSSTPVIGPDLIYFCTGHANGELWAVRPGGKGVLGDAHVAWKVKKNVPNRSSVLLLDDLIYMVDDKGIASCVEAKTGGDVWRKRIEGKGYSASPLYADGKIYFLSEEGDSTAIALGRAFSLLGEGKMGDGYMASPAVADNALFLRTRSHLYRVEKK
jgi:outer membrane protein assembly factor BamB